MENRCETMEQLRGAISRVKVKEDLSSLVRDADDLIKNTAGGMHEKAKEARSRLTAALDRAKATSEKLQEQTTAAAKAAAKKADTVIREHLYESIGVALGAGLLIGVLVARK